MHHMLSNLLNSSLLLLSLFNYWGVHGQTVSTFAGSGSAGYLDGQGTAAVFNEPRGIAFDSSRNLYVSEYVGDRIRRITPSGIVSTFAGSGTKGFRDGPDTTASFNGSNALAFDSSGNLYVADSANNRIRRITPSGLVSTFAGSGSAAFQDGEGTAAAFYYPASLAFDSAGNLYVADWSNHRIRRITPSGTVTTFAGSGTRGYQDGQGTAASFDSPSGIAIDSAGNLYVAEFGNHRIRRITPSGIVSTFAGSGSPGSLDGQGTAASFSGPRGLAFDSSGNLYVADWNNNRIRRITSSGMVTTFAGSGAQGYQDGQGTAALFRSPIGIAFDSSGNAYISDVENHRIRRIEISSITRTPNSTTNKTSSGITSILPDPSTSPSIGFISGILAGVVVILIVQAKIIYKSNFY